MATIEGVIHGKTIEDEPPGWLERLAVDPTVSPGKFVIKGTRLLVDDLVKLVEQGRSDKEVRQLHPELTGIDVEAVRQYARVPEGLRRSFGAWAQDAEELDKYLDWTREQRKVRRPEIQE
jgi:uncharacterized protein (DUF433 family)